MIKLKHLSYLLVMWVLGFVQKSKAQDFIKQPLDKIEATLKAEKAPYDLQLCENESVLTLVENGDTAIWKFDASKICYEYTLILDKSAYDDVKKHMEIMGQKVLNNAYINRRDNTITYIRREENQLIVNTKPFDPNSKEPPVYFSAN